MRRPPVIRYGEGADYSDLTADGGSVTYLQALETLDKDEAAMREATDVMRHASERIGILEEQIETQRRYIGALEREVDLADALIDDLRGEIP